jgi:hypothetical protein
MAKTRKRMWGVAAGAIGLGIVGASVAVAGLVGGGGPQKSDCYASWNITGIDVPSQRVRSNRIVLCTDGEPCDTGPCGDGICNMQAQQCWNQQDPNLPSCTPPAGLDSINVRGGLSVQIPQLLQGSSCLGSFVDVEVRTRRNGRRPGKRNFRVTAKAPRGTRPRTDQDTFQLQCLPRTVACASPSGAFLN